TPVNEEPEARLLEPLARGQVLRGRCVGILRGNEGNADKEKADDSKEFDGLHRDLIKLHSHKFKREDEIRKHWQRTLCSQPQASCERTTAAFACCCQCE